MASKNNNGATSSAFSLHAQSPISRPSPNNTRRLDSEAHENPPSFAQSEFETIIRRQRNHQGLKLANAPSKFPNLDADWQFAGWGSTSYIELSPEHHANADARAKETKLMMGQFRATSIAGNGVFGSVFYAFPAVAAASFIFSPISLFVACLILFLFRPILLELASAARMNGANYTYLAQFSGRRLGVLGAAATLLDGLATSAVSAATAAAYLAGEFGHLPIAQSAIAICLILGFSMTALVSMRESAGLTLTITIIHVCVMFALMVASIVGWARMGSGTLVANWALRPTSGPSIARAIFNGICLGFLGTTGVECTPSYIEVIDPPAYSNVLRNLLWGALILNAPLMLFVFALIPQATILSGANVLSILADTVVGRWFRIIIVVDCVSVLAGGILTGLFSVTSLIDRLAHDRVLPLFFLRTLPVTGSAYVSVVTFVVLAIILYATAAFSLSTISSIFSVTFLFIMGLYAFSAILLKFRRNRLPREYYASLWTILLALTLIIVVLIGNVVQNPKVLGLTAAYLIVVYACLSLRTNQMTLAIIAMTVYNQTTWLHRYQLDQPIVKWIRKLKRQPVCVWVDTDDVHTLLQYCLYVRKNEDTSRMLFIHTYNTIETIPSELEANSKILDEGFPSITIDLLFLKGDHCPTLVDAVSTQLDIPLARMFMSCPGPEHRYSLDQYRGVRVIKQ